MAQTSPSEFLTFYRTIRSSSRHVPAASRCLARRPISRPFTVSMQRSVDDYNELGPKKTHTVDKAAKGDQNVQSNESRKGAQLRASDQGGHATQQRDTSRSKEKAKAENPKAPGPIIGMEDERGGKGLQ